jgi:plastocyanin
MKHTYIAALIIILVGGAWYFVSKEEAQAPEAVVETDTSVEVVEEEVASAPTSEEEATAPGAKIDPVEEPEVTGTTHTFDVTGVNFAFSMEEIMVKEGDTVTINFESESGFHDWVVDEFAAATDQVKPGTPTSVTFTASKKGTFEYYCSVGSHRAAGMVGNLIVL